MNLKRVMMVFLVLAVIMSLMACASTAPVASAPASSAAAPSSAAVSSAPAASSEQAPSSAQPAAKKKIAFCIADADDQWLSYLYNEAKKFATENPDFEFLFGDGENDLAKQTAVIDNWILQKVDAIVVNPFDSVSTGPFIDKCHNAGIKIISVNRPLANQEKADAGCYGDSKQSGVLEMQYLADKLGGKGNVAIFVGEPGQEAAIMRTEGFKEVIAKYPEMKIVFEQTGHWNRAEGQKLMEDLLQSGTAVDCIASNNDEMAIGAYLALQTAKNTKIIVGGIDASPDALQYLGPDSQYVVTVFQDAHGQAYGSLGAAVSLLKGEKINPEILIPFELVTPDLKDKYLKIWGK